MVGPGEMVWTGKDKDDEMWKHFEDDEKYKAENSIAIVISVREVCVLSLSIIFLSIEIKKSISPDQVRAAGWTVSAVPLWPEITGDC